MGHLNHLGNNRNTPWVPPLCLGEPQIRSLLRHVLLAVLTASSLGDDGGARRFPGIDGPAWGRQQAEGLPRSSLTLPVWEPPTVPFTTACRPNA